jgi:hypothetical protein
MSWVLIYISTKFLAQIPLIALGIADFIFEFALKSTNFSRSIPNRLKPASTPAKAGPSQNFRTRKVTNRLKPDFRPAKAGLPAKAGSIPANAGPANQQHHLLPLDPPTLRSFRPVQLAPASHDRPKSPAQLPSLPPGHLRPSSKLQHSARYPASSRAWLQAPATKTRRHAQQLTGRPHGSVSPRPPTGPARHRSTSALPRSARFPYSQRARPAVLLSTAQRAQAPALPCPATP